MKIKFIQLLKLQKHKTKLQMKTGIIKIKAFFLYELKL